MSLLCLTAKESIVEALDIARWQFGITTVYHFMLVPLTLGLGMAIVQAIAEAHGGSATIVAGEGPGATVRIWLPDAGAPEPVST